MADRSSFLDKLKKVDIGDFHQYANQPDRYKFVLEEDDGNFYYAGGYYHDNELGTSFFASHSHRFRLDSPGTWYVLQITHGRHSHKKAISIIPCQDSSCVTKDNEVYYREGSMRILLASDPSPTASPASRRQSSRGGRRSRKLGKRLHRKRNTRR